MPYITYVTFASCHSYKHMVSCPPQYSNSCTKKFSTYDSSHTTTCSMQALLISFFTLLLAWGNENMNVKVMLLTPTLQYLGVWHFPFAVEELTTQQDPCSSHEDLVLLCFHYCETMRIPKQMSRMVSVESERTCF